MFNILSLDPGNATGFVSTEYDPQTATFGDTDMGVLNGLDEAFAYIRSYAAIKNRTIVVYEGFDLNPGNEFVADLTGVEIIGALKYAFPHGWLHKRRRSDKVQVSDETLKEHGLWVTGGDVDWEDGRDVNDAWIHLIGYLCFDAQDTAALRRFYR